MYRRLLLFFLFLVASSPVSRSDDKELRDLDVSAWPCLNQPGGTAKTPDGMERNQMKNRSPVDLRTAKTEAFDTAGFLKKVAVYDSRLNAHRRTELSPAAKQILAGYENQLVSLTGYLVLAYPGPPESTNCGDKNFHDWHLELFQQTSDHGPEVGDPTPIICEITPRTEQQIYRDGTRLQSIAGFFRDRKDYVSTGHSAQLIRVTGWLTWDDEHNGTADIGSNVQYFTPGNGFHHPWRSTAWEIHPILKIEVVDSRALTPQNTPALATPAATPQTSAAPAQEFVTLLQPVKIKVPYGETILPRGMRLPVVSRDQETVRVKYLEGVYPIPASVVSP